MDDSKDLKELRKIEKTILEEAEEIKKSEQAI